MKLEILKKLYIYVDTKDRILKMAYLTLAGSEENNGCFKFIGTAATTNSHVGLISSNTSLISSNTSLISASFDDGMDTCSFYSGPNDAAILAFGESSESCGSIAYNGSESCGSIAYSGGGESCGSVASVSVSSGSSFSGGCSYSC